MNEEEKPSGLRRAAARAVGGLGGLALAAVPAYLARGAVHRRLWTRLARPHYRRMDRLEKAEWKTKQLLDRWFDGTRPPSRTGADFPRRAEALVKRIEKRIPHVEKDIRTARRTATAGGLASFLGVAGVGGYGGQKLVASTQEKRSALNPFCEGAIIALLGDHEKLASAPHRERRNLDNRFSKDGTGLARMARAASRGHTFDLDMLPKKRMEEKGSGYSPHLDYTVQGAQQWLEEQNGPRELANNDAFEQSYGQFKGGSLRDLVKQALVDSDFLSDAAIVGLSALGAGGATKGLGRRAMGLKGAKKLTPEKLKMLKNIEMTGRVLGGGGAFYQLKKERQPQYSYWRQ